MRYGLPIALCYIHEFLCSHEGRQIIWRVSRDHFLDDIFQSTSFIVCEVGVRFSARFGAKYEPNRTANALLLKYDTVRTPFSKQSVENKQILVEMFCFSFPCMNIPYHQVV